MTDDTLYRIRPLEVVVKKMYLLIIETPFANVTINSFDGENWSVFANHKSLGIDETRLFSDSDKAVEYVRTCYHHTLTQCLIPHTPEE